MNSDAIIRKEMIMGKIRSKLTFIFGTGDLEDVESIIDFYEQKVNQLETNIDEAINIIKNHIDCEVVLDGILLFPTKKIIDVLERGKNENNRFIK